LKNTAHIKCDRTWRELLLHRCVWIEDW